MAGRPLIFVSFVVIALSLPLVARAASPDPRARLSWVACAGSPDGCIWQTVRGDGSEPRTLRSFADRDAPLTVALGPSGATVAVAEAGEITVRSASSGRRLRSLVRLGRPDIEPPLAWSADGTRLAYATPGAVWAVGVDSSAPRLLLRRKGVRALAWSPKGRKLAFIQSSHDGERAELWVAAGDGAGVRRLAVGFLFGEPSWSADGKRLVFALGRFASSSNGIVYSTNVATGGRRRIGRGITPRYSPVSREVAYVFLSRSSPHVTLVVATLDGRAKRIPVEWDGATAPVWSPDGREVVGVKEFALEAVRVDGRGKRKLADTWVYVSNLSWEG